MNRTEECVIDRERTLHELTASRHPSRSTATSQSRMRERKILAALSPEDLALPPSS